MKVWIFDVAEMEASAPGELGGQPGMRLDDLLVALAVVVHELLAARDLAARHDDEVGPRVHLEQRGGPSRPSRPRSTASTFSGRTNVELNGKQTFKNVTNRESRKAKEI